jgi:hypothetical protein
MESLSVTFSGFFLVVMIPRTGFFRERNHIVKKQLVLIGCLLFAAAIFTSMSEAQVKTIRMATPGYTSAMMSFLAAKTNGYYTAEGLEV